MGPMTLLFNKEVRLIKKGMILMVAMLLLMTCLSACANDNSTVEADNNLQLELVISKSEYASNEPIDCKAILSYVGNENSFSFHSGEPIVMFSIGGNKYFKGALDLINKGFYLHTIEKEKPEEYLFSKNFGSYVSSDTEAAEFWRDFHSSNELLLDSGEYEIFAQVNYAITPGELNSYHTITVKKAITVK